MLLTILTNIVISLAILSAAWFGGNWVRTQISNTKKLDTTLRSFLGGLAKYTLLTIAVITVLNQFGIQTASLIAVLGAAGLAIGLALQGTLSNVAAGVMLLIIRPFNVGDFIEFNGKSGTVKSLGLFGTELSTLDNVYVYAPNSSIWNADIYNFNRNPERRHDLVIGVSYGDDINQAFQIIQDTLNNDKRILSAQDKAPMIAVKELGASSVNLLVRIWTASDHLQVRLDTFKHIKEALDKGGITIPFPTQTLTFTDTQSAEAFKEKAAPKKTARKAAAE